MAKQFAPSTGRRIGNGFVAALVRLGIGPRNTYLLTVPGRRTGLPRTTPVTLIEDAEARWLVAAYGTVDWVRNARAAGRVTLRRGRRTEQVTVTEVDRRVAAPVLRRYVTKLRVVRPYFDATPESPVEDYVAEADRHPVFALS